jgi:hypothetical protein
MRATVAVLLVPESVLRDLALQEALARRLEAAARRLEARVLMPNTAKQRHDAKCTREQRDAERRGRPAVREPGRRADLVEPDQLQAPHEESPP